ncbi:RecQ family ATP-dependent DNA helicase [Vagococcus elongatus]|uniref:ATP-dependent DNA helicase RecQ n=1 Tax=Vagococcus elongatus TaxID=180344 RepID=A0A430B5F1_9ENTE|nr:ATP-dependent DNA helicase RecQ [Vagococcus elongatus]RSU15574.1 hypothetical protein CBF29_00425 [Vagococcus elongatus]
MNEEIQQVLKQRFGFSSFKKGQEETITKILTRNNVLSILPTGTGKSLCYQLPSYLLSGVTIVVSPLLSLIEDQVRQLQRTGEKQAVAFGSQLTYQEKQWVLAHIAAYKFIFITPESLFQEEILQRIRQLDVGLFVVDEAHCVSTWGIDFRPDYERLASIIQHLGVKKVLALTATATEVVKEDIRQKLFLGQEIDLVQKTVNRVNIFYHVEKLSTVEEKLSWLQSFCSKYSGPGLIYCNTRRDTEEVSLYLSGNTTLKTAYYHGGLTSMERSAIQQQFLADELDVLIATSAFGMGIDKPNIRYVIHYQLPDSLEAFIQESGRGGRDGLQTLSVVLYMAQDQKVHQYFQKELLKEINDFTHLVPLTQNNDSIVLDHFSELQKKWYDFSKSENHSIENLQEKIKKRVEEKAEKLARMEDYLDTDGCRREKILSYFSETSTVQQEICCDNCHREISDFPIGLMSPDSNKKYSKLEKSKEILKNLF